MASIPWNPYYIILDTLESCFFLIWPSLRMLLFFSCGDFQCVPRFCYRASCSSSCTCSCACSYQPWKTKRHRQTFILHTGFRTSAFHVISSVCHLEYPSCLSLLWHGMPCPIIACCLMTTCVVTSCHDMPWHHISRQDKWWNNPMIDMSWHDVLWQAMAWHLEKMTWHAMTWIEL